VAGQAGDPCVRHRIGDGEVVEAGPTAAGLAIKQPIVVRDAEPASQGRDPPVVGSHLDRSKGWANTSGARAVGGVNPIDVRFNAKNETAELIVESELASRDECAPVVYIAEAQAEESVGQIPLAPGSTEVGADIESSPSERRRQIDWRRNRTRIRRYLSGIRDHRQCKQRRCRADGLQ